MKTLINNILVVDDEESIRWVLNTSLSKQGYNVTTAEDGKTALEAITKNKFSVILLDLNLPDISGFDLLHNIRQKGVKSSVIVITAKNSGKNAIEAMKSGAYDYISKPFDIDDISFLVKKAIDNFRYVTELDHARAEESIKADASHGIVGRSTSITNIYKLIGRIVDKDITVLITGESGVGKELIARAIHYNSMRKKNNLVSVNIAAIPNELLESELFGYEKGAFTGATFRKMGRFEEANNGTLHLDEIGDMSPDLQTKLLRILEEKKLYRLGSEKPFNIDVRVIVSTNRDLTQEVDNGNFRKDLFYRLNAITINVPPLRERKDDIPLLIDYFQDKYCGELGVSKKVFSKDALNLLSNYNWPGNVRELENTVKRILVLSVDKMVNLETLLEAAPSLVQTKVKKDIVESDFYEQISKYVRSFEGNLPTNFYNNILQKIEKPLIEEILILTNGNKKKAAELLGINRNTLSKKISEQDIE